MSGKGSPARKKDEIVVFSIRRESRCAACWRVLERGDWLRIVDDKALCLKCAGLEHLEYLPAGDATLTLRASRHSPLRAVVVRWARARNRYERQGILVTAEALAKAQAECQADAPERERRRKARAAKREEEDQPYLHDFAAEVRRLFPGCPPGVEGKIAQHAYWRHSGRPGRRAKAKRLDEAAIRKAVAAHIRFHHTDYNALLDIQVPRRAARSAVQEQVQAILAAWTVPGA